jgi:hypothetical protein
MAERSHVRLCSFRVKGYGVIFIYFLNILIDSEPVTWF